MFVEMKTKLMMRDEDKQISAAEEIISRIRQAKQQKKKKFVEDLLRFNIGHALCDVMGTTNDKLLRPVLDCFSSLSDNINFYENDLANLAVDKIMKTSFFLLRKRLLYEKIIYKMLLTVEDILEGAEKHQVDLLNVCDITRMIEYLNDFAAVGDWEMKPKMCSVRIFKQIVPVIGVPMDEKSSQMVKKAFEDHLKCMQQIIELRGDINCPITLTAIKYMCEISCQAVWYCSMLRDTYTSDPYLIPPPKSLHSTLILSLTSTTSKSLTKSVIPHLQKLNKKTKNFTSILKFFLNYLNQLYDLDDIDTLDLSKSLAINNYLMYLFQEGRDQALQQNCWFPSSISQFLSHILTNLAVKEKSLGIDTTPGDVLDFRTSISEGIMTSIESPNPSMTSTAFLTLVYFHHKTTREEIKIPFDLIVEKVLKTPDQRLSVQEVKIMWFFMAKLMLKESERPKDLSEAVFKVFESVNRLGVDKCFLEDSDVVKSVLGHPMGHDIREKILEMWIEADGGVDDLWNDYTQDNLIFCLWKLIQNGKKEFVEKVKKSLEILIIKHNLEGIMREFFLQRIPDILAEYDESKSHNLIAILELFDYVGEDDFSGDFGILCAPNIVRIFRDDTDAKVGCSLMNFTSKILKFGWNSDPRIAKIFIGKSEIIKGILTEGLNWKRDDEFSGICLFNLAVILVCQKKHGLKSEESIILEEMDIYSPLMRKKGVSLAAVNLLTVILQENVESPIIKFEGFSSEAQRDSIVYGIYDRIIALHEMYRPDQWAILYKCLMTVLKFCERRRYRTTLSLCCDSPAHFFLVFFATENQDISTEFFNFVIHWLKTSMLIITDNVKYTLTCRDKVKRNAFAPKLPFGKTLELLNGFVNFLKDDTRVNQSSLNSLKSLLEKLI